MIRPDEWGLAPFDASLLAPLMAGVAPAQLSAIVTAFAQEASTGRRIGAVEAALQAGGAPWRSEIGRWVTRIVPVEMLVPDAYREWRPLVGEAIRFVFSRLSDGRLAAKLVEQIELPAGTPPEARLLRLISKMPGLQKIGQVLARNRSLPSALREALTELENGMSDVMPEEIRAIIVDRLGPRLEACAVEVDSRIFKEGSASAIVRFTWKQPGGERGRGVFKVLKPYVPQCFAEDMTLLQQVGDFLASQGSSYAFAVRDVNQMLAEVRLLLEHELDFPREQAVLAVAHRAYRSSFGIRVPRLIDALSTSDITAMTDEDGVKVTNAAPRSPIRRSRIAEQVVEALITVPLFSRQDPAIFHADPHAGNLLYDEPNRELVVIDWALAERMSLELRRHLVMLALMMILRNPAGVREAIRALSRRAPGRRRTEERLIDRAVNRFFHRLPPGRSPGTLDAMLLLDEIALEGVHFPAPLFLFRKTVFTLDGVLHDIAGSRVRIDYVLAREFLTRGIASLGVFHSPLRMKDLASLQWNALLYPMRSWTRAHTPALVTGSHA